MSEHDYMAQRAADKLRGLKDELAGRLRCVHVYSVGSDDGCMIPESGIAEALSGLDWIEDVARYVEGDRDALARLPVGRLS